MLTLATPIIELHKHGVAKLTLAMARKLATALAPVASKTDVDLVTVEDLLNYFPARYEDRSNFVQIDQIEDGHEAAVEIFVKVAGGYQVGKNRDPRRPPLFIFEISGSNASNNLKPVVVKWFVSGRNAKDIVTWYGQKFTQGTRFVAYGLWQWETRKQAFELMVAKPDEIEVLSADSAEVARKDEENVLDPSLETIHTGRVPVYRKLGPFLTKRLREIVHSVLATLDAGTVTDDLPADLQKRNSLISRADALKQIHFPPDGTSITDYEMFRSPAQKRFIFEELFWLSFAMQMISRIV